MSGEVEVDYYRLSGQAGELFTIADALDQAVSAGLAAQEMSQQAFGLLCIGMVPPAQLVQTAAVAALKAEAAAYEAAAMNLRNGAADYEATDTKSAMAYRNLMGRMG